MVRCYLETYCPDMFLMSVVKTCGRVCDKTAAELRLNAIAPGVIPTEGASKRLSPGETLGERTEVVTVI
jgi:hypothetical protein